MKVAILLSGGVGSRMGLEMPKQYVQVEGYPVFYYCLKTLLNNENTDVLVVGVADEWNAYVKEILLKLNSTKKVLFAQPGETRQYSIFNALKLLQAEQYQADDIVLIHDAARPLVSNSLINRCYEGCKEADGVIPMLSVKDTTYLSEDGKHIKALLNRSHLWSGQAPEAFRFGKYLQIHEEMSRENLLKINGSTEIAFQAGLNCQMIEGDPMNFKITTPEDLLNFERIISKS